jgi:hypothetical protein
VRADPAPICARNTAIGAHEALGSVLNKAGYWDRFAKDPLNKRQIMVLKRLLGGFEGKLTTRRTETWLTSSSAVH